MGSTNRAVIEESSFLLVSAVEKDGLSACVHCKEYMYRALNHAHSTWYETVVESMRTLQLPGESASNRILALVASSPWLGITISMVEYVGKRRSGMIISISETVMVEKR